MIAMQYESLEPVIMWSKNYILFFKSNQPFAQLIAAIPLSLVPRYALRGPRGCCTPRDGATDWHPLRREDLNYRIYAHPRANLRPLGQCAPLSSNPVAFRAQEIGLWDRQETSVEAHACGT